MSTKMKKITPDLMVANVSESVAFYVDKLGFQLDMAVPENEKAIDTELDSEKNYVYAMVHCEDVFVMFMRQDVYTQDLPALKDMPIGASASLYIDMENAEDFYDEIKDKVDVVKELSVTWYGMNEFYIRDNSGYVLGFSSPKKS